MICFRCFVFFNCHSYTLQDRHTTQQRAMPMKMSVMELSICEVQCGPDSPLMFSSVFVLVKYCKTIKKAQRRAI